MISTRCGRITDRGGHDEVVAMAQRWTRVRIRSFAVRHELVRANVRNAIRTERPSSCGAWWGIGGCVSFDSHAGTNGSFSLPVRLGPLPLERAMSLTAASE